MKILREIPSERGGFRNPPVITLGSFDGVHLGHRRIFSTVLNIAREKGGEAIVLTFSTHPRKILTPKTPPRILTTAPEKLRAIQNCGIENVIMLDFTADMANMDAADFLNEIVLKKLGIIDFVVGYDHAFGKNRGGTIDFLREISKLRGFAVTRVEPKNFYSRPVSSSWIRTEIEDGNIRLAATLLGRNYTLRGSISRGAGRGRQIGFPTANIIPDDSDKVIPKDGVYAVRTLLESGEPMPGMLNIGTNPTFANTERTIEVNILGWSGDIYGRSMEIEFVDRIRDEMKFASVQLLVEQIERDRLCVMEILNV
jgi:riboflavin kinase/FMN adenylyltransferase